MFSKNSLSIVHKSKPIKDVDIITQFKWLIKQVSSDKPFNNLISKDVLPISFSDYNTKKSAQNLSIRRPISNITETEVVHNSELEKCIDYVSRKVALAFIYSKINGGLINLKGESSNKSYEDTIKNYLGSNHASNFFYLNKEEKGQKTEDYSIKLDKSNLDSISMYAGSLMSSDDSLKINPNETYTVKNSLKLYISKYIAMFTINKHSEYLKIYTDNQAAINPFNGFIKNNDFGDLKYDVALLKHVLKLIVNKYPHVEKDLDLQLRSLLQKNRGILDTETFTKRTLLLICQYLLTDSNENINNYLTCIDMADLKDSDIKYENINFEVSEHNTGKTKSLIDKCSKDIFQISLRDALKKNLLTAQDEFKTMLNVLIIQTAIDKAPYFIKQVNTRITNSYAYGCGVNEQGESVLCEYGNPIFDIIGDFAINKDLFNKENGNSIFDSKFIICLMILIIQAFGQTKISNIANGSLTLFEGVVNLDKDKLIYGEEITAANMTNRSSIVKLLNNPIILKILNNFMEQIFKLITPPAAAVCNIRTYESYLLDNAAIPVNFNVEYNVATTRKKAILILTYIKNASTNDLQQIKYNSISDSEFITAMDELSNVKMANIIKSEFNNADVDSLTESLVTNKNQYYNLTTPNGTNNVQIVNNIIAQHVPPAAPNIGSQLYDGIVAIRDTPRFTISQILRLSPVLHFEAEANIVNQLALYHNKVDVDKLYKLKMAHTYSNLFVKVDKDLLNKSKTAVKDLDIINTQNISLVYNHAITYIKGVEADILPANVLNVAAVDNARVLACRILAAALPRINAAATLVQIRQAITDSIAVVVGANIDPITNMLSINAKRQDFINKLTDALSARVPDGDINPFIAAITGAGDLVTAIVGGGRFVGGGVNLVAAVLDGGVAGAGGGPPAIAAADGAINAAIAAGAAPGDPVIIAATIAREFLYITPLAGTIALAGGISGGGVAGPPNWDLRKNYIAGFISHNNFRVPNAVIAAALGHGTPHDGGDCTTIVRLITALSLQIKNVARMIKYEIFMESVFPTKLLKSAYMHIAQLKDKPNIPPVEIPSTQNLLADKYYNVMRAQDMKLPNAPFLTRQVLNIINTPRQLAEGKCRQILDYIKQYQSNIIVNNITIKLIDNNTLSASDTDSFIAYNLLININRYSDLFAGRNANIIPTPTPLSIGQCSYLSVGGAFVPGGVAPAAADGTMPIPLAVGMAPVDTIGVAVLNNNYSLVVHNVAGIAQDPAPFRTINEIEIPGPGFASIATANDTISNIARDIKVKLITKYSTNPPVGDATIAQCTDLIIGIAPIINQQTKERVLRQVDTKYVFAKQLVDYTIKDYIKLVKSLLISRLETHSELSELIRKHNEICIKSIEDNFSPVDESNPVYSMFNIELSEIINHQLLIGITQLSNKSIVFPFAKSNYMKDEYVEDVSIVQANQSMEIIEENGEVLLVDNTGSKTNLYNIVLQDNDMCRFFGLKIDEYKCRGIFGTCKSNNPDNCKKEFVNSTYSEVSAELQHWASLSAKEKQARAVAILLKFGFTGDRTNGDRDFTVYDRKKIETHMGMDPTTPNYDGKMALLETYMKLADKVVYTAKPATSTSTNPKYSIPQLVITPSIIKPRQQIMINRNALTSRFQHLITGRHLYGQTGRGKLSDEIKTLVEKAEKNLNDVLYNNTIKNDKYLKIVSAISKSKTIASDLDNYENVLDTVKKTVNDKQNKNTSIMIADFEQAYMDIINRKAPSTINKLNKLNDFLSEFTTYIPY